MCILPSLILLPRLVQSGGSPRSSPIGDFFRENPVPPHQSAGTGEHSRRQPQNRPKRLSSPIETAKMQTSDPKAKFAAKEKIENPREAKADS